MGGHRSWKTLRAKLERLAGSDQMCADAEQVRADHETHQRRLAELPAEGDLRVWLDDDLVDRAAPDGWVQVTTAWLAIDLLEQGRVVELSLDHDLGDDERFGRGIDVCDWLAERQEVHGERLWPRDGITLHTANPEGRNQMERSIRNYASRHGRVRRSLTRGGKVKLEFD